MLSASSVRRRSVKFTDRPPQVVRYSYHAGADASTSLFAANSAVGAIMPLTRNRPRLGAREPTYANYNPGPAEPLYDTVPATSSPVVNNITISTPTARRYPVTGAGVSRVAIGEPNNVGYVSVHQRRPEANTYYQHPVTAVPPHNHRQGIVFEELPEETTDETADEFEEINLHIFDCSSQFTEAINKVIQAKQFLVDNESKIPLHDYDKLLKKVDKVIAEGRNRLAAVVPDALDSDVSMSKSSRLNSSSTQTATTTASPSPTSMANTSSNGGEPVLDASFIQRHGPQLMHLLQSVCNEQNMAKRN
uniref:Uncharacterized protein n=1 Tax=Panagrellus redivivus TaxID=6233 RepID=A0A7E4URB2_PANRE